MKEALRGLKENYTNFSERMSRKEYFFFCLIKCSVLIFLGITQSFFQVSERVREAIVS